MPCMVPSEGDVTAPYAAERECPNMPSAVLVADRQAGSFRLEIDWIGVYGD